MEGRDVGELTVVARESVRAVNSLGGAECRLASLAP